MLNENDSDSVIENKLKIMNTYNKRNPRKKIKILNKLINLNLQF